jgi:acyl dehydratase
MQIDSNIVGTHIDPADCVAGAREAMNYAAAVGDDNPAYFDDRGENRLIAHPMFAVALTWPWFGALAELLVKSGVAPEVLSTLVHYSEHLVFHHPLRLGTKLTMTGSVAAVQPHRAGTLITLNLAAHDDGTKIFTEEIGGLLRGVNCTDAGRIGEALQPVPSNPEETKIGWEQAIRIDPLLPYVYDGCTGIHFPIHTSPRFAHQVGLPGIILQGTATLALAVRELVNREAGRNPAMVRALGGRFGAMVRPGSTIRVRQLGARNRSNAREVFFEVLNASGQFAIRNGWVSLKNR